MKECQTDIHPYIFTNSQVVLVRLSPSCKWLSNFVKIIFFWLQTAKSKESVDTSCEMPVANAQATEDREDIKETIKSIKKASRNKRNKLTNLLKILKSILEEELKCSQIQETNDDIVDKVRQNSEIESEIENYNRTVEESMCKDTLNKSFDCSKILERITAALERSRAFSNNDNKIKEPIKMVPIFKKSSEDSIPLMEDNISTKPQSQCLTQSNQLDNMPPIPMAKLASIDSNSEYIGQSHMNAVPDGRQFIIPCHRTSDILDDRYLIPKTTYGDTNSKTNLKPAVKTIKYNFKQTNPISNSASCKEDVTVAMLLKPAALSLMQVYGNLLKKLTVTVLVPYYVSKLGL